MRGPVIGGPADGLEVNLATTFRWIDPETGTGYRSVRSGCALYRRDGARYVHVGRRCKGCGAILSTEFSCPLCGRER